MEALAEHDFGLKAHRNVSCNGMSTNCLRHFTVHRQSPAVHDLDLKAHRNVPCNGMSTNCLRHFTLHRQSPAVHDFVLQQEIPVAEQMDAQLAERNPALQAPLARKKCVLNAHFILKTHRNVPCNRMSTNCLRHFTVHRQSFAAAYTL